MKKLFLSVAILATTAFAANAQTHTLDIDALYEVIVAEAEADGPAAIVSNAKYLLNADRAQGIFTLISPNTRTLRIDNIDGNFPDGSGGNNDKPTVPVTFANGITSGHRLETNGLSNSTNGRKIYINAPSAGMLKVGAWSNGDEGRGYDVVFGGSILAGSPTQLSKDAGEIQEFNISSAGVIELNPNGTGQIYYGTIQFVQTTTSINDANADKGEPASVEYFNILGSQVSADATGLVIVKKTYADGSTSAEKVFKK